MKFKLNFLFVLFFVISVSCFAQDKSNDTSMEKKIYTEERGVWMNRSEIIRPKEKILEFLDKCKSINLNTVYINTYFKGGVIYPNSKYMPLVEEAKKLDYDVLEYVISECHKRGLRAESWVEYGFYCYHTADATSDTTRGVILDKNPKLAAIDSEGVPYLHNKDWGDFYSLCPANPESHKILTDIFLEMVNKYEFDGLNLDRIRFPQRNFCFCQYCKEHFKTDNGIELKMYPESSKEYEIFLKWREEQINKFMQQFSNKIRSAKKGIIITSAVIPIEDKRARGQDWFTWIKEGYVDAVIPMLYTDASFDRNLADINENLGNSKTVFAGLNVDTNSPEVVAKQIEKARLSGMGGIVLWYSGSIDNDIPILKDNYFKEKSLSPFPLLNKKE